MIETRASVLALWCAVFGEPPPLQADPELLLRVLVEHLPQAPPYGAAVAAPKEPAS